MTFVLAATAHGPMICNTNDYAEVPEGSGRRYGVGHQLLTNGCYDPAEVAYTKALLDLLRRYRGDGVVAVDGGANVGVFTVEWARHMRGWGRVIAFEMQERIYHALCGNITLNNLDNVHARLCALADKDNGACLQVPRLDHSRHASFGSLSLLEEVFNDTGQEISEDTIFDVVARETLDNAFYSGRIDLLKLDVEGMELQALKGAMELIKRCRPIIVVEWLKSERDKLHGFMTDLSYEMFAHALNWICVPRGDNIVDHVKEWRIG